jgi:hypothetical protein
MEANKPFDAEEDGKSDLQKILNRMPANIAKTFSKEQLDHLHSALGTRSWRKHSIDVRTTFPLPFFKSRLYLVFLLGKNRRDLTRTEKQISAFTVSALVVGFILASALFGLLVLYLIKSALGINLFKNFSLGIWDWFKGLW